MILRKSNSIMALHTTPTTIRVCEADASQTLNFSPQVAEYCDSGLLLEVDANPVDAGVGHSFALTAGGQKEGVIALDFRSESETVLD